MPDAPVVTLKVAGLTLTSFDGLTIETSLDSFADGFSFDMASSPEIRAKLKPRAYTPCEILINDRPVITGRIEKISTSMSSAMLNVQGRSLTGSMVDCSLGEPSNWSNLTLGKIGKEKAGLYGLTLSLPQGDSSGVGEAVGNPEQTVADFLQGLAHDMGWLWHCNPSGALELTMPTGKGPTFATLEEGTGSLQEVSIESDDTAMFQTYKVTMQTGGWPDVKDSVTDPGIKIHRFHQRAGSTGAPGQIKKACELDRAQAIASAFTVSVTVSDWTTDADALWEPGKIVSLKAPSCYINAPTLFMIAGVSFELTSGHRATSLRLVLPETYTGAMPARFPWD